MKIKHLMVTVGNQPLAALAAIVSLKPETVILIVSDSSEDSVEGLHRAVAELGHTVEWLPPVSVDPESPAHIATVAESHKDDKWFKTGHFAYTGGTKPMSWAWGQVWDTVRDSGTKAWYVADDLGKILADDDSPAVSVDKSVNLSFKSLVELHGWKVVPGGNGPLPDDLDAVMAAVAAMKSSVVVGKKVQPREGGKEENVQVAAVDGWQLTLVRRPPTGEKPKSTLPRAAEFSRALGGALARVVVLGGSPQPFDHLDNRDNIGAGSIGRPQRIHIPEGADASAGLKNFFCGLPGQAIAEEGERPLEDVVVPAVTPTIPKGSLCITLGLNPLAVLAAAFAATNRLRVKKLASVAVLHTEIDSDGLDQGSQSGEAFSLSMKTSRAALREALFTYADEVSFVLCGPHDSPSELQRFFTDSELLAGSSLDATGGTKALTLAAARAWTKQNPETPTQDGPRLSYTVTSGNWVHSRSTSYPQFVQPFVDTTFSVSEIVRMHGFTVEEGRSTESEKHLVGPVVQALRNAGWQVETAQSLRLLEGPANGQISDFDVVAVKGLVMMVIEAKSSTDDNLGELAKTVRRARLGGGSQSLAVLLSKQELPESSVKARFPSERAASFSYAQYDILVDWANQWAGTE